MRKGYLSHSELEANSESGEHLFSAGNMVKQNFSEGALIH
jgi:hypothetical protein